MQDLDQQTRIILYYYGIRTLWKGLSLTCPFFVRYIGWVVVRLSNVLADGASNCFAVGDFALFLLSLFPFLVKNANAKLSEKGYLH